MARRTIKDTTGHPSKGHFASVASAVKTVLVCAAITWLSATIIFIELGDYIQPVSCGKGCQDV